MREASWRPGKMRDGLPRIPCAKCGSTTSRWPGELFPMCAACRVGYPNWKPAQRLEANDDER